MFHIFSALSIFMIFTEAQFDYEILGAEYNDLDNFYWEPKMAKPGIKVDLKPEDDDYEGFGFTYDEPGGKAPSRSSRRLAGKQTDDRFSQDEKMELVRLHNIYRNNVTPPAADMEWMQWDEKLAEMAQAWANTCYFEHGIPSKPRYYNKIGQNLYMGWDRAIWRPLYLWYEEYKDYDFHTTYCPPNKQCGHYITMVWAKSNKVGCAVHPCPPNYYVVCHYHPPGNFQGERPYRVGIPCSLCGSADGGLCYSNMCVTKNDCQRDNLQCTCNLKCHNCGTLDREKCTCNCKAGWDFLDCSVQCSDENEHCRRNPGFPNKFSCPTNEGRVQRIYCRKMCGECDEGESSTNTCCNRKECSPGYVLDSNCECRLLCPGAKCDEIREESPTQSRQYKPNLPTKTQQKPKPPVISKHRPSQSDYSRQKFPSGMQRHPWSPYGTMNRPRPPAETDIGLSPKYGTERKRPNSDRPVPPPVDNERPRYPTEAESSFNRDKEWLEDNEDWEIPPPDDEDDTVDYYDYSSATVRSSSTISIELLLIMYHLL